MGFRNRIWKMALLWRNQQISPNIIILRDDGFGVVEMATDKKNLWGLVRVFSRSKKPIIHSFSKSYAPKAFIYSKHRDDSAVYFEVQTRIARFIHAKGLFVQWKPKFHSLETLTTHQRTANANPSLSAEES